MPSVLNILLTHQPADAVMAMVEWWQKCVARDSILLAYGGRREDFAAARMTLASVTARGPSRNW